MRVKPGQLVRASGQSDNVKSPPRPGAQRALFVRGQGDKARKVQAAGSLRAMGASFSPAACPIKEQAE